MLLLRVGKFFLCFVGWLLELLACERPLTGYSRPLLILRWLWGSVFRSSFILSVYFFSTSEICWLHYAENISIVDCLFIKVGWQTCLTLAQMCSNPITGYITFLITTVYRVFLFRPLSINDTVYSYSQRSLHLLYVSSLHDITCH